MHPPEKLPSRVKETPGPFIPLHIKVIGTFFFTGYLPKAPGTAGSIAALIPVLLFPSMGAAGLAVLIVLGLGAGVYAAARIERVLGEDPQIIVIDEAVGMWITLVFVPLTPVTIGAGFVLFRLFDILKPYPIRSLENFTHGWGVMLDDVGAGVYAGLLLMLLHGFV